MTDKKVVSIREKALAAKVEFRSKNVEIDLGGEKVTVEFREPSSKVRGNITNQAQKIIQKGGEQQIALDTNALHVHAVIGLAYDPSTGKQVWDRADFDTLAARPRSWLDLWIKPALEMMGEEDIEQEVKN